MVNPDLIQAATDAKLKGMTE